MNKQDDLEKQGGLRCLLYCGLRSEDAKDFAELHDLYDEGSFCRDNGKDTWDMIGEFHAAWPGRRLRDVDAIGIDIALRIARKRRILEGRTLRKGNEEFEGQLWLGRALLSAGMDDITTSEFMTINSHIVEVADLRMMTKYEIGSLVSHYNAMRGSKGRIDAATEENLKDLAGGRASTRKVGGDTTIVRMGDTLEPSGGQGTMEGTSGHTRDEGSAEALMDILEGCGVPRPGQFLVANPHVTTPLRFLQMSEQEMNTALYNNRQIGGRVPSKIASNLRTLQMCAKIVEDAGFTIQAGGNPKPSKLGNDLLYLQGAPRGGSSAKTTYGKGRTGPKRKAIAKRQKCNPPNGYDDAQGLEAVERLRQERYPEHADTSICTFATCSFSHNDFDILGEHGRRMVHVLRKLNGATKDGDTQPYLAQGIRDIESFRKEYHPSCMHLSLAAYTRFSFSIDDYTRLGQCGRDAIFHLRNQDPHPWEYP